MSVSLDKSGIGYTEDGNDKTTELKFSINKTMGLYCIPCGNEGYTTIGFDYAQKRILHVLQWLGGFAEHPVLTGVKELKKEFRNVTKGTLAHYQLYDKVMSLGEAFHAATKLKCRKDLIPEFKNREGEYVACIVDDELVSFKIGISSGWFPCHLMITDGEIGGSPVYEKDISNIERAIYFNK